MRGIIFLCVLLTLPFLAAVSHDVYLAYEDGTLLSGEMIKLSDLGWIWKQYHIDSYNEARRSVSEETWQTYISPILRERSVVVTAIPAGILYVTLLILRILGLWPFSGKGLLSRRGKVTKGKKSDFSFDKTQKKAAAKYKRK